MLINIQSAIAIMLLALVITLITATGSYHLADQEYTLAVLPVGVAVLALSIVFPQVIMLVLVALVPLDTFAELAGLSKIFTLTKVLFPLALAGLLIGKIVGRMQAPAPHRLDLWVLFWVGLNLFLVVNAQDSEVAQTYIRRLFSMGLFYYVLTRLFHDPVWNQRLQNTAILSAGLSVIIGLVASAAGYNPFISGYEYDAVRLTGASHVSPNFYSIMLVVPLAIVVSYLFSSASNIQKLLYIGAAGLMLTGIALSYSRSGFVALAAVMVLALLIWGRNVGARHWLGLLMLCIVSLFFLPIEFWDRLGSLNIISDGKRADASLSNRFNYILVGINIVKDYPLFGAGPGNFQVLHALAEYQTEVYNIGEQRMPHNMYLQAVTETGVIGLIILLGMLSSALSITLGALKKPQQIRWLAGALFIALGGYLVMGLFSHLMLNKYLWILLAMIRVLPELQKNDPQTNYPRLRTA